MVDYAWKGTTPVTGEAFDAFSVRWTGSLVPPVNGTYRLGVKGFSGYRLYLNREVLVEWYGIHHAITQTKDVELEAGRVYDLKLEYVNRGIDPNVQLLWSVPSVDYEAQALEVAGRADVVVVVMGLSPTLEGEEMPVQVPGFVGGDRTDIALPRPQQDLLKNIHALGKPVVLVLINGSALAIDWAQQNVPAILEAWYPGGQGGSAIADVLFGDYNPGGRLPVTFYRSVDDLPPFTDYSMEDRTYRYYRGDPLYPFGYGLSYTRFRYRNLEVTPRSTREAEPIQVSVKVWNGGQRTGNEVVQVYVTDLEASVPVPIRQLVAFRRVRLAGGEMKTLSFAIQPEQLSLIADDGSRVVEGGEFEIAVGGCQPGYEYLTGESTEVLTETVKITRSYSIPER
jgi:beta-glucosidase